MLCNVWGNDMGPYFLFRGKLFSCALTPKDTVKCWDFVQPKLEELESTNEVYFIQDGATRHTSSTNMNRPASSPSGQDARHSLSAAAIRGDIFEAIYFRLNGDTLVYCAYEFVWNGGIQFYELFGPRAPPILWSPWFESPDYKFVSNVFFVSRWMF